MTFNKMRKQSYFLSRLLNQRALEARGSEAAVHRRPSLLLQNRKTEISDCGGSPAGRSPFPASKLPPALNAMGDIEMPEPAFSQGCFRLLPVQTHLTLYRDTLQNHLPHVQRIHRYVLTEIQNISALSVIRSF